MSTQRQDFETIMGSAVTGILSSVADYLASEKEIIVSVQELQEALNVPRSTPARVPARTTPARSRSTPTAKASERRHKDQGQIEGYCEHLLTSGKFKDHFCASKMTTTVSTPEGDLKRCGACAKRLEKKLEKEAAKPAPKAGVAPGQKKKKKEETADSEAPVAVRHPDNPDLFILEKYGLVLDKNQKVIGTTDETKETKPLTPEAIDFVKKHKLNCIAQFEYTPLEEVPGLAVANIEGENILIQSDTMVAVGKFDEEENVQPLTEADLDPIKAANLAFVLNATFETEGDEEGPGEDEEGEASEKPEEPEVQEQPEEPEEPELKPVKETKKTARKIQKRPIGRNRN